MVNKVILIGFMGKDPEVRYTPGGQAVASLRMATSRGWIDRETGQRKEEAEWHDVEVWGKPAEACGEYLAKGGRLYVEGRIKTDRWKDKQSGGGPLPGEGRRRLGPVHRPWQRQPGRRARARAARRGGGSAPRGRPRIGSHTRGGALRRPASSSPCHPLAGAASRARLWRPSAPLVPPAHSLITVGHLARGEGALPPLDLERLQVSLPRAAPRRPPGARRGAARGGPMRTVTIHSIRPNRSSALWLIATVPGFKSFAQSANGDR